jgi:hypothetical protein
MYDIFMTTTVIHNKNIIINYMVYRDSLSIIAGCIYLFYALGYPDRCYGLRVSAILFSILWILRGILDIFKDGVDDYTGLKGGIDGFAVLSAALFMYHYDGRKCPNTRGILWIVIIVAVTSLLIYSKYFQSINN